MIKKIRYSRIELIKGLKIEKSIMKYSKLVRTDIKLQNENVVILMDITNNNMGLYGYYNNTRKISIEKRGVARCALLFLIEELLQREEIKDNFIIEVISPTVTKDGMDKYVKNIDILIQIYRNIGFDYNSKHKLVSTIKNVKTKLENICENLDN